MSSPPSNDYYKIAMSSYSYRNTKLLYTLANSLSMQVMGLTTVRYPPSLTNLVEEGAHMVIRAHLKQINERQYGTQQMSSLTSSW